MYVHVMGKYSLANHWSASISGEKVMMIIISQYYIHVCVCVYANKCIMTVFCISLCV